MTLGHIAIAANVPFIVCRCFTLWIAVSDQEQLFVLKNKG